MINEHIISIGGRGNIASPLQFGQDYAVTLEGSITSITDINNEDGTINRLFKLKTAIIKEIEGKEGKIAIRDKSSLSKRIRSRQFIWAQENQSDIDYEKFGQLLLQNFDGVMDYLTEQQNI